MIFALREAATAADVTEAAALFGEYAEALGSFARVRRSAPYTEKPVQGALFLELVLGRG